jgi:NH3-dependent NAD+ synthetase
MSFLCGFVIGVAGGQDSNLCGARKQAAYILVKPPPLMYILSVTGDYFR